MTRDEIFAAINQERERQNEIHPLWRGNQHGLSVLVEEIGEVARALYEMTASYALDPEAWEKNLREELIQSSAVCVRWLENLE